MNGSIREFTDGASTCPWCYSDVVVATDQFRRSPDGDGHWLQAMMCGACGRGWYDIIDTEEIRARTIR